MENRFKNRQFRSGGLQCLKRLYVMNVADNPRNTLELTGV